LLEGVEEALDEIALAIEGEVGLSRVLALAFGGMTGVIPRSSSFSTRASAS
jgi:hypothetical protein